MKKLVALLFALSLTACLAGTKTDVYTGYAESGKITEFDSSAIQIRQIDLINSVRAENGLGPVRLNPQLTAAALTHARDIAKQNRAWNFGSDQSTPQTRGVRAGFVGIVTGEMVAETYLGEFEVFAKWYSHPLSREAILHSGATDAGIAYYMDDSGKVWWVTNFGQSGASQTN